MTRADALGFLLAAVLLAEWLIFDLTLAGVLIPAGIYLLLVLDGVFRPASPWFMPVITHGSRNVPLVALTFDDGPDAEVTPKVLDALKAAGATATFFTIGRCLEANPALARRIHAEGHELGNHSYAHSRTLNFAREKGMQREILKGADTIQSVTGRTSMPLYRPPVGLKSPPLARVAGRLGLKVVNWSLHGHDTGSAPADKIARQLLERVRAGDIIVLHDGHDLPGKSRPQTAEAVHLILQGLADKNLRSVTVSELLRSA